MFLYYLLGCGPIGLYAISLCKYFGAKKMYVLSY